MIQSFGDDGTEDVFNDESTKKARDVCPQQIWSVARRKLFAVYAAKDLNDLRTPPGNRLEPLRGELEDYHSIRINRQYRVIFRWTEEGPEDVTITDYH